ncbi:TniQ family protein [Paenibacillus zanthoxyli]|uniref:TniQ family protein n=1 Tax=Paenibacillus zanthoxyli TaxID=369399 RepID=UPI0018DD24F6|nr:TniQ family protein [Paenibacillus zanthoxyli]
MFSVQFRPKLDESLSSYLIRLAMENGISILTLWNKCRKQEMTHIQRADLNLIDTLPNSVLEIEKLTHFCGISNDELYNSTFHNLHRVFYCEGTAEKSRFLKGMIRREIHYCPICLREDAYIRSLWRINGVSSCVKHSCYLLQNCGKCGLPIDVNNLFNPSICPNCYSELSEEVGEYVENIDILKQQQWLSLAWEELLYNRYLSLVHEQECGMKLLYILNGSKPMYDRTYLKGTLEAYSVRLDTILQYARGTLKQRRKLHLNLILKVLFDYNISISDFFEIKIPESFKKSVIATTAKKQAIVCLSPWCSSYGTANALVKTGTLSKVYKDGSYLKTHMACLDCGCEYAYDREGQVKEKSYFADGYRFIQESKPLSLAEFQRNSGYPLNACIRIAAYFNARDLWDFRSVAVDEKLLASFATAVSKNISLTDIQNWPCWKEKYHYLIHRLHPKVMREIILLKRPAKERLPKLDYWEKLIQCCEANMLKDVTITIGGVSSQIGVTPKTLAKWGYVSYVKEMKEKQRGLRLERRRKMLYEKIDDYFKMHSENKIFSKDVYNFIGVRQSYLCGIIPEINDYVKSEMQILRENIVI